MSTASHRPRAARRLSRQRTVLWLGASLAALAVVVGVALPVVLAMVASFRVPDASDPQVAAEAARVAEVTAASDVAGDEDASCSARVLRRSPETTWAWTTCRVRQESPDAVESWRSGPTRLDGTTVSVPGDGARFGEDVERMFPPDLAQLVLRRPESIRPADPAPSP